MTFVMTGCRTTAQRRARGTGAAWWDASTRPWTQLGEVPMTNPSYVMPDPHHGTIWVLHGDGETLAILSGEDPGRVLATLGCAGRNPVHVAQPRPDLVVVADYASGGLASFRLDDGGLPVGPPAVLQLQGLPGPVTDQQRGPHPHQVLVDPDGRTLWVPDKGTDAVHRLELAPDPVIVARHPMPAGSGPRHAVRRGDLLHVVEELSSTLATHRVHADGLETLRRTSTRADANATGDCTGAGIVLLPSGRSLVVSNRGDDTLAFFGFDEHGLPVLADVVPSGVRGPRFIGLEEASGTLFVAGELSHEVALLDVSSGLPTGAPQVVARTGSPTCVAVLPGAPCSAEEVSA